MSSSLKLIEPDFPLYEFSPNKSEETLFYIDND